MDSICITGFGIKTICIVEGSAVGVEGYHNLIFYKTCLKACVEVADKPISVFANVRGKTVFAGRTLRSYFALLTIFAGSLNSERSPRCALIIGNVPEIVFTDFKLRCNTVFAIFTARTLLTLRALRTNLALFSLRTLRANFTLFSLRTLRTHFSVFSVLARSLYAKGSPGFAVVVGNVPEIVFTDFKLRCNTVFAVFTARTLGAGFTARTLRTNLALLTVCAVFTRCLDTKRSPSCAFIVGNVPIVVISDFEDRCNTILSVFTGRALRTLWTLGSDFALFTLGANRTNLTLFTVFALRTLGTNGTNFTLLTVLTGSFYAKGSPSNAVIVGNVPIIVSANLQLGSDTVFALRTLGTNGTNFTLLAFGTLFTLGAGRTLFTFGTNGSDFACLTVLTGGLYAKGSPGFAVVVGNVPKVIFANLKLGSNTVFTGFSFFTLLTLNTLLALNTLFTLGTTISLVVVTSNKSKSANQDSK